MRDEEATGPLTQASAPISGSPRNRKIPWGESAPGRPGRRRCKELPVRGSTASRLLALVALASLALVSCARSAPGASNLKPADLYAAGPTVGDVRTLLGDSNWWQGPPSFGVRPLDATSIPETERFSVAQRFIRLGTAEEFFVRYTLYDTVAAATAVMKNLKDSYGATTPLQKVGDDTLYLGSGPSEGGAPYISRTIARLGQVMVQISWARKDGQPTIQQLVRNGTKIIAGLKKVVDGKAHASPPQADPKLLPNPGLDITYLGSAQLPIEAWVVMTRKAIPGPLVDALHVLGINDFAYGDYALNNDTHMEVLTALFTFPSPAAATQWVQLFGPGKPDSSGIDWTYQPVAGSVEGSGEYHYYFAAGTHGAMMVCAATIPGEAASRACEAPMERVAISWGLALSA